MTTPRRKMRSEIRAQGMYTPFDTQVNMRVVQQSIASATESWVSRIAIRPRHEAADFFAFLLLRHCVSHAAENF